MIPGRYRVTELDEAGEPIKTSILLVERVDDPQPEPSAPVGRWRFDEDGRDDVGGRTATLFEGATADGPSLVEGVDGRSLALDGRSWAIIPAAGSMPELTLSIYARPRSDATKQVIACEGGGYAPGDWSIERQPSGLLRAWHVNATGVLTPFGDWGGVSGAVMRAGQAARIDLTLGPTGASLYLDGRHVAQVPHGNGDSGFPITLGAWWGTDDAAARLIGDIDHVRLWDRQLNGAEIAALEPAAPPEPVDPGEPWSDGTFDDDGNGWVEALTDDSIHVFDDPAVRITIAENARSLLVPGPPSVQFSPCEAGVEIEIDGQEVYRGPLSEAPANVLADLGRAVAAACMDDEQ